MGLAIVVVMTTSVVTCYNSPHNNESESVFICSVRAVNLLLDHHLWLHMYRSG